MRYRVDRATGRLRPGALLALATAAMLLVVFGVAGLAAQNGPQRQTDGVKVPRTPYVPPSGELSGDNSVICRVQEGIEVQRNAFTNGFAVAADGTFWVGTGSGDVRHYGRDCALLQNLTTLTATDIEAAGDSVWVLSERRYLYRLSLDGLIAEQIDLAGGATEVERSYYPAPTINWKLKSGEAGEMLIEHYQGNYLRVADLRADQARRDTPAALPTPLSAYYANGKPYVTANRQGSVWTGGPELRIDLRAAFDNADRVECERMLHVAPDGSFYVAVEAFSDMLAPPYVAAPRVYVLHYTADGRLLERARVTTPGGFDTRAYLIERGPDGAFYSVGQWGWTPSHPPGRADIVRLNFVPADQPMPDAPTPVPTPVYPTPVPTVHHPITPVPPPVPTDAPRPGEERLSSMARILDGVVVGRVVDYSDGGDVANAAVYTLEVEEWLKRPLNAGGVEAIRIQVWLDTKSELWRMTGADFWNDRSARFVLFLTSRGSSLGWEYPQFELMSAPERVYKIGADGTVTYAGIEKYKGMPGDELVALIRHYLETAATPVAK